MEGEECTHICTSTWHMRCVRRVGPGGTLNTRARRGSVWRSVGGDDCGAALALAAPGRLGASREITVADELGPSR